MSRSTAGARARRPAVLVAGVCALALSVLGACARPYDAAPVVPLTAAERARRVPPGEDELRRDLFAFADDSMRGRETGTPDALRAARFIADRLAALGLSPMGDSGFYQRVPLTRRDFASRTSFWVARGADTIRLALERDLLPAVHLEGMVPPRRDADGEIVFAGYGMKRHRHRDDLAHLNLRNKIAVVVNGAPAGADSATRAWQEGPDAIGERLLRVMQKRPAAVLIVLTGAGNAMYDELVPEMMRNVSAAATGLQAHDPDDEDSPIPLIAFVRAQASSPLLPAGWPADDKPQPLPGWFHGHVELVRTPAPSFNVVAVVPGRDPALRGQFVAFGAHYDHLGVLPAVNGDSIANGADDDGSGSVTLLALARALHDAPPRRSVLFVWHTGEEKGLYGSEWFTDHPTVSLDSVVAQLNADMIGRNAPDSLYVVGPIAAPGGQSRVLGAVVDSVNALLPRPFAFDRTWDSPDHPEQIYYRSDHYSYARRGVPIVFFTSGLHKEYHTVADEPATIDYAKLAHVAQLMFETAEALGDRRTRPR